MRSSAPIHLYCLLLLALSVASGCSATCPQIRCNYTQALAAETELDQSLTPGKLPVQFGLTIETDLLNRVVNAGLQQALESGLSALSKVDVGAGKTIGVRTSGEVLNLRIEAADACDHCFRISGDLGGAVALDIPFIGKKRTPLDGELSLVAPLILARGEHGGGVLKLDLSQAARIGRSSLVARLGNLPGSWTRVLRSKLSTMLLDELLGGAEAVALFSFDGPDLGIPGMEIFPVALVTDAESGTIFAGFSTNIIGLQNDPSIPVVTELSDDQNLALSFNPDLVVHALSLMMKKDVLPRQYSSDGQPLRGGPAHASINAIRFSKGRVGELPMEVDFSIYNFGEQESVCYQFRGKATGRIALRPRALEVSLTDVEVVDSSIPGLANAGNWSQAEFLRGSKTIVRESLDEQNIEIPGATLEFQGLSIELNDGAVVLKGVAVAVGAE
jgi:hypothetical protein